MTPDAIVNAADELLDMRATHRVEADLPEPLRPMSFQDAYAIQAFDVHAMDYLLKPIEPARFKKALARALQRGPLDRLVIRAHGKVTFVKPADIDWIEATDYYARVHVGGVSHLHRESLKSLAATLDTKRFVRAHRSALINVDRIDTIEKLPSGDGVAVLSTGQRIRVSRSSSLLSRGSLRRSTSR